jgi:crotonobetainyl-CoA:carnitine CoA-transferase CaiB-like acyl-CoA transferase
MVRFVAYALFTSGPRLDRRSFFLMPTFLHTLIGMNEALYGPDGPPGALDGILVADFSRVLAGPYLTMLLGDLGATVVKVESPEGDQTRTWGPPWRDGISTYYQSVNRNKQSVVLDLADPHDNRLARELAQRADILIENLMPHRMRKFGLDYEQVAQTNEGLIYCSLTGFGPGDSDHTLPGFDLVAQAASGLMSVTGERDGSPMKVGVAVVDIVCGLHAGLGVLAALAARPRMGRGQLVEVNLLTSALSVLANQSAAQLMAGVIPYREGNAHPSVAPYEVFDVGDGELVIAAGTDSQFARLCAALGVPEAAADARFCTNSARVAHRDDLRQLIVKQLARRTRTEVMDCLEAAGVPVGPVNNLEEAFEFAKALKLNATWNISGVDHVRAPVFMSGTPPRPSAPPPMLDESGDSLRAWLSAAVSERTNQAR